MSRYKTRNEKAVFYLGRKRSNRAHWIFIAIIVFVIIIVPIYGTTLRYDVSIVLRSIFAAVGLICLFIGGTLVIVALGFAFLARNFYFKSLILGTVLLWVGAFLYDVQVDFFGILIGQNNPSQGYH